jgi:hypothetical protein
VTAALARGTHSSCIQLCCCAGRALQSVRGAAQVWAGSRVAMIATTWLCCWRAVGCSARQVLESGLVVG